MVRSQVRRGRPGRRLQSLGNPRIDEYRALDVSCESLAHKIIRACNICGFLCFQISKKLPNLPLSLNVQKPKVFQLQGGAPCPLTRGSAPGPRWGLRHQTPVIGWRSTLSSLSNSFCCLRCVAVAAIDPVEWPPVSGQCLVP